MTDHTEPKPLRVATASEIAALLRVHVDKVYAMAQTGELPQLRRVGPELRFDMDTIESWLRGSDSGITPGVDTSVDTLGTPEVAARLEDDEGTR